MASRSPKLLKYEREARKQGFLRVAGIDEAGRGPLAGPVVAAACVIPYGVFFPDVDDSKKLPSSLREEIFHRLTEDPSISYAVSIVDHETVDKINIAQAAKLAMLNACKGLALQPDLLLVDGVALPHPTIPHWKIIHGDALSHSIAAASILAKVVRDRIMEELDARFPQYGFKHHKGYGTKEHLEALKRHGPCEIHRRTYSPVRSLLGEGLLD